MAVLIQSYDDGQVRPWTYVPAKAGTYSAGLACVFDATNGYVKAVVSGTGQDNQAGKHCVCMSDVVVAADNGIIPVVQTDDQLTWAVPLQAANSSLKVGAAYTLYTDGKQLTSTTTNGCFTVTGYEGKGAGDLVYGHLV